MILSWADLSLTGKGLVVIALPLVILIGSLLALYLAFDAEARAEDEVRRAFAIQRDMYQVHALLAEAGSGVREFVLSGEARALEPLRETQTRLPETLSRLDASIRDEGVRQAFGVFLSLAGQKLEGLQSLAQLADAGNERDARMDAVLASLASNRFILDELRLQIDEIQRLEQLVLDRRRSEVEIDRARFLWLTGISAIVGLLGSLAAVLLFSSGIVRRVQLLEGNAEKLERGEVLDPLPEEADEIGQLARKLDRASSLLRAREKELRDGEERFRLVVEGVRDYGIFVLSPDGLVATWNAGAERIKGWTADEILGVYFGRFYPEETRGFLPESMLSRARRDGRAEDEGWRLRKDGTRFWANVVITALFDETGALKGYAKVTRDMTDRKRSEEALLSAQREAIAASRAKSEFLSRTSHELRTPMAAILGFAQVLELDQDRFDSRQKVAIGQILKAGRHLLSLITDLLDISSIEAGGEDVEVQSVNLGDVFEEARALAGAVIGASGGHLDMELPASRVDVLADKRRVVQVLLNLLTNAAKYGDSGGRIILSAKVSGDQALVEVSDSGPGVSEGDIPRLFTPFDRLGSQSSKTIEGTGLGLALSKRLVQSMSGEIGFRNRAAPEKGSVFWFTLPLFMPGNTSTSISMGFPSEHKQD
jgi:PAS domain S-box-containing protein